ncbi:hypothetical protein Avbf_00574 [Armadillidium vulgare]|nr:hypothetical protein Avbf_00574 [Armadillidium vulgare]
MVHSIASKISLNTAIILCNIICNIHLNFLERYLVTKLKKEIKNLKEENSSLNETLKQTVNENIEITSKFDSLKKKNNLTEDERKRLFEENGKLKELSADYKSLLESQNVELRDMKIFFITSIVVNFQLHSFKLIKAIGKESYCVVEPKETEVKIGMNLER